MNLGNKELEFGFERALKLLCDHAPVGEDRRKPLVMHAVRVGTFLFNNNYSEDIVLGGLLHDIVEWTDAPEALIANEFGQHVLDIVLANTKNREIQDKTERRIDMITRCSKIGVGALIVKSADTIDSFHFYQATNNTNEIQRAVDIATLIIEHLPPGMSDPIFEELKKLG